MQLRWLGWVGVGEWSRKDAAQLPRVCGRSCDGVDGRVESKRCSSAAKIAEMKRFSASEKKLLGLSNEKKFKSESKAEEEELIGTKTDALHDAEGDKATETDARDADQKL